MRLLPVLCLAACAALPARAQAPTAGGAPLPGSMASVVGDAVSQPLATPPRRMVVAPHPLAAEAGLAVLREGGSAADAAVAAEMVLAVVAPQSTGLGGGGVALSYLAASGTVMGWDGRERAPAAVGPELFLGRDGAPMARLDAALGGRAVGVPGLVRMLEVLHHEQGKLPWEHLFDAAIRLADSGFPISAELAAAIAADADHLRRLPATRGYFFLADGSPLPAGSMAVNKPLAETLRAIATGGADALLRGAIAADIAAAVRSDPSPGLMTTDDLAAFAARPLPALCGRYRMMKVCGMPPPSAGGVTLLQVLGLLEHFNLPAFRPGGVDFVHLLIEAEKLAFADKALHLADSDFADVPVRGLIDPAYLTARAQLIDIAHANPTPQAGHPSFLDPSLLPAAPQPEHGTSDIAVLDDAGNAISLTSSIEDPFGARLLVRGFLLNDALVDFAFVPEQDGRRVANRVAGGKRPLTSMAPTLVLGPDGALRIVIGGAGGEHIIGFVAEALARMIDFALPPGQALAAPHAWAHGPTTELEQGTAAAGLADALRARGQTVVLTPLPSGQQAIMLSADGAVGATDPRGTGAVARD